MLAPSAAAAALAVLPPTLRIIKQQGEHNVHPFRSVEDIFECMIMFNSLSCKHCSAHDLDCDAGLLYERSKKCSCCERDQVPCEISMSKEDYEKMEMYRKFQASVDQTQRQLLSSYLVCIKNL